MTPEFVISFATEAITTATKLAAPLLITALVIGLAVSIFQAVTQIQEMTFSFQSPSHEDAVDSPLECPQNEKMIYFTAARKPDDPHVGRIGDPHDPRQICRTKSTEMTGKGDDSGFPIRRNLTGRFHPGCSRIVCRLDLLFHFESLWSIPTVYRILWVYYFCRFIWVKVLGVRRKS